MIHILNCCAAATGNTLSSAAVEDAVLMTLLRGHGIDNGNNPAQFFFIHLNILQMFVVTHTRNHVDEIGQRSHFSNLKHLIPKIFKGKLIFSKLSLQFNSLFFVHHGLSLLNHRQDIAHSQNPGCHSIRMEHFKIIKFFTNTDEFYRLIDDRLDGNCSSTSGISVHFGQNHAANIQRIIKGGGDVHCILTGHCISHKQNIRWLHPVPNTDKLLHQLRINVKPTCGIQNQSIQAFPVRLISGFHADINRIHVLCRRKHRN